MTGVHNLELMVHRSIDVFAGAEEFFAGDVIDFVMVIMTLWSISRAS